jgi:ribosomal-protein-alanine N-acetyltransferase
MALEDACFGRGPYRKHRFARGHYRYYLRNAQALLLLGMRDGAPVASVLAISGRASRSEVGRILSIAVAPGHRRLGIGLNLLREALQTLRERGCKRVYLDVAERAVAARALFDSVGFEPARRLPAYYGDGIDGIRMRRDISDV